MDVTSRLIHRIPLNSEPCSLADLAVRDADILQRGHEPCYPLHHVVERAVLRIRPVRDPQPAEVCESGEPRDKVEERTEWL